MTGPLRRWDLFGSLDVLAALWSTAAVGPVSSGAATAYRTVFNTARRLLVGRRITARLTGGDVTLTVTELEWTPDVRGLSVGQLSDVRLSASDIRWDGGHLDRATALLRKPAWRTSSPNSTRSGGH